MSTLAQLEEQLSCLNTLNRSSTRAIDAFADTSNAISTRANQIIRDVKPWEVAQENVALSIEEMSKAARCYHPPPVLPAVLSRKETNPEAVVRCIDYLVYTDDYLSSHPPNDYGSQIMLRAEKQLKDIVKISEDLVKAAFIDALQRPKVAAAAQTMGAPPCPGVSTPVSNTGGCSAYVVKNEGALRGIDKVVQRLGESFNRTDVVQNDVRRTMESKMTALLQTQFDGTYRDEEGGKVNRTSTHPLGQVLKHYQRGDHRLLKISAMARDIVVEVSTCLHHYILAPLDNDYAVAEIPAELATVAFDLIMQRAERLVHFDVALFSNPTQLFVDARGQGAGLAFTTRYLRDFIFIGLDLVEELWRWKNVAKELPGENSNFIDHVDDRFDGFSFLVRELLDGYANSKGAIEKEALKEAVRTQRRLEWLPLVNCSVHESTTNVLFFHKVLLASYYGALKIVLYGSVMGPNAGMESVKEVEDYIMRGVSGTLEDLQTIATAAFELQQEALSKGHQHVKPGSFNLLSSDVEFSCSIFIANNIAFIEDNYKRETLFELRLATQESLHSISSKQANRKGKSEAPVDPPLTQMYAMLDAEKDQCVVDFGASWIACFPSFSDHSSLASIQAGDTTPLRKSQRMAMKEWHRHVTKALLQKIANCKVAAVVNSPLRLSLMDASAAAVRGEFLRIERLLGGRTWSSQPTKWMPCSTAEWEEQIKKAF